MSITERVERRQQIERNRELRDKFCRRAERALARRKLNLYEYYREQALIHARNVRQLSDYQKFNCTVITAAPSRR